MASESINDINNSFQQQRGVGDPFHPVDLPPPEDWIPGPKLFPDQVITGYYALYKAYDADTWAKYVLEKAKGYDAATSCASWSGERFFLIGLTCRTDLM